MYRFGYGWSVPICGILPANSNLPLQVGGYPLKVTPMTFQQATVWQWNIVPVGNPDANYFLGLYNSTSWIYGTLNNALAIGFSTTLTSGDPSGCPNNTPRSSSVYMQCNSQYNTSNPKIVSREIKTCVCKFLLYFYLYTFG